MPRKRKSPKDKPICPRCGLPIDWYERVRQGNRVYLYAVHYLGYEKTPSGKIRKKVKKCYLGPETAYIYASTTHQNIGLILRGAHDPERVLDYLDALIRYLESPHFELRPEIMRKIAARLRVLADSLEDLARIEEEKAREEEGA